MNSRGERLSCSLLLFERSQPANSYSRSSSESNFSQNGRIKMRIIHEPAYRVASQCYVLFVLVRSFIESPDDKRRARSAFLEAIFSNFD